MSDPAASIAALHRARREGRTSFAQVIDACLDRAGTGEGPRCFVSLRADAARNESAREDAAFAAGPARPLAGVPVSIKDAFDVAGEVTRAGARLLADAPPATETSSAVALLQAAGAIAVGRTTMSEFAFSGVGTNPWFGTPRSPYRRSPDDPAQGCIPGGSTSGGAVSVADGMAMVALGTDTGGSCRIPAALCGLVGFKPTARLVDRTGLFALAPSLDSIGWMARTVADCRVLFDVLASPPPQAATGTAPLRLAIVETYPFDSCEPPVVGAFAAAVAQLEAAGASIVRLQIPALDRIAGLNAAGGLVALEAWQGLGQRVLADPDRCDPHIRARILLGRDIDAAAERGMRTMRAEIADAVCAAAAPFDALLFPTVPLAAPRLTQVAGPDDFIRINRLLLRNTAIANLIDGCSITLPCHAAGEAPVGLMLTAGPLVDARLLGVAARVERSLAG